MTTKQLHWMDIRQGEIKELIENTRTYLFDDKWDYRNRAEYFLPVRFIDHYHQKLWIDSEFKTDLD